MGHGFNSCVSLPEGSFPTFTKLSSVCWICWAVKHPRDNVLMSKQPSWSSNSLPKMLRVVICCMIYYYLLPEDQVKCPHSKLATRNTRGSAEWFKISNIQKDTSNRGDVYLLDVSLWATWNVHFEHCTACTRAGTGCPIRATIRCLAWNCAAETVG